MNLTPLVLGIYIAPEAGAPMQSRQWATASKGQGLLGDRYATGTGSWNKGRSGKRQVTLMNACFFHPSRFTWPESRRNLITDGIELMKLIGLSFRVGQATLRGVAYCEPCLRPGKLIGRDTSFRATFHDRGGLIAEVLESGEIRVEDTITVSI